MRVGILTRLAVDLDPDTSVRGIACGGGWRQSADGRRMIETFCGIPRRAGFLRLSLAIAAREIDRMNNPDVRVARSLATLFNPVLYPGVGEVLRITQQELAYLVGLSRQRVNEALTALQAQGIIRVEYGGLRVLDLPALRSRVISKQTNLKPR